MDSFSFYNPTKIVFGEGSVKQLPELLAQYGPTVLLTYGGGSIKKNGVYDAVMAELAKAGKNVVELPGIMSNPRKEKVLEGAQLCREHNVDLVLAVGGGSVVDCSKFIGAVALVDEDYDWWQHFFVKRENVKRALPVGVVLTMSATGSEMNNRGVVTDWEAQKKLGGYGDALYPQFSILDPTYTYTLPKNQMIYGICDMLSHLMEQYFSLPETNNLSDALLEATFKNIMANAAIALENQEDYEARSNLMWGATIALNGILGLGKKQDWMSHQIEHALSAFYDIPHGAGLAIVHPMVLKYIYKGHIPRFVRFAINIWGLKRDDFESDEALALAGIEALRNYFKSIGAPTTLGEVNIPKEALPKIAASSNRYPTSYTNFTTEDILAIYESAL
ncbi:MAG: iron-containing alcohol dehydrogenase [Veillonella sp.]|uniref:iron-containing alcohol dehydrogenase n=1 Tax=Veillonella sp. TaxID=1926307 RepID=UPI0025CD080F|nr:iron-containing alcohol dehydrogenase [Veillonella sp.]MBS4914255.1 iron-containing alcohol dehydrogenase [Veillonella sp.]